MAPKYETSLVQADPQCGQRTGLSGGPRVSRMGPLTGRGTYCWPAEPTWNGHPPPREFGEYVATPS